MFRIEDLTVFVRAAELGSLSAAARNLNTSPAVASSAIKRLEEKLGSRLFARSTRSLGLTSEGSEFFAHARGALVMLEDGFHKLRRSHEEIRGAIKISAPSDLGRNTLMSWLGEFQGIYPGLKICFQVGDNLSDLYRQSVDIAIRYGELEDSSMVALPLALDNRRVLCAAPSYLEKMGYPDKLGDLLQHECILYERAEKIHDRWSFSKNGVVETIQVFGALSSNDADVVRRWAVEGRGLAYKSWLDIAPDVHSGKLAVVFSEYKGEPAPLNMVFSHRLQLSKAFRILHEFLKKRFLQYSQDYHVLV